MSHAKRVTKDDRKNQEYHVVSAVIWKLTKTVPLSLLRSFSLASMFTSLSIFGWSDLLQILRKPAAFSFVVLYIILFIFYLIWFFFIIAAQRTLPTKIRQWLLAIPLTIRYLYYLLYNTSLEYNSYTSFTVCLFLCFFFSITHICT